MKWPLDVAQWWNRQLYQVLMWAHKASKVASSRCIAKLSVALEYFAGWKLQMIKERVFSLIFCLCVFVHLYKLGISLTGVWLPYGSIFKGKVWIKVEWYISQD